MSKTIKQTTTINASPDEVYEALMDSKKHAEFTGDDAKIDNKVGGKFTAYGDYIEGENVELVADKKIVQKWRASDWPDAHFSTATFELKEKDGKTELKFTQENVPDENFDEISKGWYDYYWNPLNNYFKE